MRLFRMLQCVSKLPSNYGNFPASYVKKETEQIAWKTPKGPQYRPAVIKRKKNYYYLARPWEDKFKDDNKPGSLRAKVFVKPIVDFSFFRGDLVEILIGKDKGKQGKINYIVEERNFVCVEGLNCVHRYQGQEGDMPGFLRKEEVPLLVPDEVCLLDPSDNKPTEIEWRYTEKGEKVRVSLRTGRIVPIPKQATETKDFKTRATYLEQEKDTPSAEASKITFKPALKTFEQDIMDEMKIDEDRIPKELYWY